MAEQDEINKIIEATDIVALVSQYVKLEKNGKNYKGLCPFHNEDTPSFIVNPEKRLAHCFGCGSGGNPLKFLMQIENISFPEAIKKLALFNGIEYHDNYIKKEDPNEKYYKIMQVAVDFYQAFYENTEDGLAAKKYLNERGLDDETIKEFNIGLSGKSYDNLYKVLKESNYLELDMTDCGLVDRSDNGTYYDLFRERIMFPIHNEAGLPVGFSARNYLDNPTNPQKYINTRDTKIFNKSDIIFNLHRAKPAILKKKQVILHEGQMDVIATYRAGLKEVVCTMGVALSQNQVNRLKKYTDHVIIMYDSDFAGIKASKAAADLFYKNGFKVNLVLLDLAKDPDEFVKKFGVDEYKNFVESNMLTIDNYTYITSLRKTNLLDTNSVEEFKSEIFNMLMGLNSQTLVDKYLDKLSLDLNSNIESLKTDYNNYQANNQPLDYGQYSSEAVIYSGDVNQYDYIPDYEEPTTIAKRDELRPEALNKVFYYATYSKSNAKYINEFLSKDDLISAFPESLQSLWMKLYDEYYNNYDDFENGLFLKYLDEDSIELKEYQNIQEYIKGLKRFDINIVYNQNDLSDCLEKLKKLKINNEMKHISESIKKDGNKEDLNKLFEKKSKKNANTGGKKRK